VAEVYPDAFRSHPPVKISAAEVEVVAQVLANHVGVGVVHRDHQLPTGLEHRSERGDEPLIVIDVVEHQSTGDGVEVLFVFGQRLAEVAHPILDGAIGILLPGDLDQAGRDVDAGDLGGSGGEDP
jgi:hypothetical protein